MKSPECPPIVPMRSLNPNIKYSSKTWTWLLGKEYLIEIEFASFLNPFQNVIFPLYCSTLCNRICGLSNTWEWMGEKMNYLSPHFLIDKPKISLEPFIMYLMMQVIDGFLIFQLLSFNLILLLIICKSEKSLCKNYFYAVTIIRKKITIEQTGWNNGISTLTKMIQ